MNVRADVVAGFPFAETFGEKVRIALRPLIDKNPIQRLPFSCKSKSTEPSVISVTPGGLKWVSLLMWARADPRTLGP